jgi:hypothetical protein
LIIDAHTHILPDEFRQDRARIAAADATFGTLFANEMARTASAEELAASMDEAGVAVSVAAGYGWTDAGVASMANDYALEAGREFPGQIIPFCSVNPLWGEAAARELRRCAEAGAKGVGELHPDTQGFSTANPDALKRIAPVMDAARVYGLSVLVHASEAVGHAYPGKGTFTPEKAIALAMTYPDNTFIFAHFGGGLPFYAQMPEVGDALKNAWFDSAAQPLVYRSRAYPTAASAAGESKVLFASDFPLISQKRALAEVRSAGLPSASLEEILGLAAARLFKLGVSPPA